MTERFSTLELTAFTERLLCEAGVAAHEAQVVSEALVWSDAVGRSNHGLWRLGAYLARFRQGLITSPCAPAKTQHAPAVADVDGHNGFGHYVAAFGMRTAMQLATDTGLGLVTVRNSNHFGAGGYFVHLAAREGMLGLATSNSVAKLAPHGGVRPVFGTNPIAIGIPRCGAPPIVIDMATAAVSGGSVLRAAERQESIPEGIITDVTGQPITDARRAHEGAMLPFGGAKGSSLALFVEVLAGVLTHGALSTEVRSMFTDFTGPARVGHCFLAIDVGRVLPFDDYASRLELLVSGMLGAAPPGEDGLRLPGDERWAAMSRSDRIGVEVDLATLTELQRLAERAGIPLPAACAGSAPGNP
jgi:LDH2 family malate/lactate/ureidoglycolate dehydrogenase